MENLDYEKALNYLIGQVMKRTKGLADPKLVRQILEEMIQKKLNELK